MDAPTAAKRLSMDVVIEDARDAAPAHRRSAEAEAEAADADGPLRKKQKRNKPTLSCEECVERKTKVRPATEQSAISSNNADLMSFSVIVPDRYA